MEEARDALQQRISDGEPMFPHEAASLFMALEREHAARIASIQGEYSVLRAGFVEQLAKLEARNMRLWPDNGSSFYSLFWVCVALVSMTGIIAFSLT